MPRSFQRSNGGLGRVHGLPGSEQWRVGDQLVAWFSDPDARTWQRYMVIATLRKVRVVRGVTGER